jgi:putative SOS response-associated peptidase YedK
MCYYSSISVGFKIIETRFGVKFLQSELFKPVYSASAFTFPLMPAITNDNPDEIVLLQWGLIPFWVKDYPAASKIRQFTINARSETIFTKPAFRNSIVSKRCLALVNGFFEWRHFYNKNYPYFIGLTNHEPFALAGIWDKWQNHDTGNEVSTFSVITTQANSLVEQIHNTRKRMPVILSKENEKRWIANNLGKEEIESMLKPYDSSEMEAYPVDSSISRLGFNTSNPSVLNKKEYRDLPPLTLN